MCTLYVWKLEDSVRFCILSKNSEFLVPLSILPDPFTFFTGTHKLSGSSASWSPISAPWIPGLGACISFPKMGPSLVSNRTTMAYGWKSTGSYQPLPAGVARRSHQQQWQFGSLVPSQRHRRLPLSWDAGDLGPVQDPLGIFVAGKLEALPTRCPTLQFPCCLGPGIN